MYWAKLDATDRVIAIGVGQATYFTQQLVAMGAVQITKAQYQQLSSGGPWFLRAGVIASS